VFLVELTNCFDVIGLVICNLLFFEARQSGKFWQLGKCLAIWQNLCQNLYMHYAIKQVFGNKASFWKLGKFLATRQLSFSK